jgi:hypothetical protein
VMLRGLREDRTAQRREGGEDKDDALHCSLHR